MRSSRHSYRNVAIFGGLVVIVVVAAERFRAKPMTEATAYGITEPLLARPLFVPRFWWNTQERLTEVLHSTRFPTGVDSPSLSSPVYHARQTNSSDQAFENLSGEDIIYFVKACKRYSRRAVAMYKSWGSLVKHLVFSTDYLLEGVPESMQIASNLDSSEAQKYVAEGRKRQNVGIPRSCGVSVNNLGKLLRDERFQNAKWLVLLDDDTFVLPRNLQAYLSYFNSSQPYYMGFSNAEIPGFVTRRKFVPMSSTAPGCAYSKTVMDTLRAGGPQLDIADQSVALKVCVKVKYKDDAAIGFLSMVEAGAKFVARPELRGYHFRDMKDPVEWTPLTIHSELAFLEAVDPMLVLMKLHDKYKSYLNG